MTCTFCYNDKIRCVQPEGSSCCAECARQQRRCDGPVDVSSLPQLSKQLEKLGSEEKLATEELQRLTREVAEAIEDLDPRIKEAEARPEATDSASTQYLDSMTTRLEELQSKISIVRNRVRRLRKQQEWVENRSSNIFGRGMRELDEEDGIITYDDDGKLMNIDHQSRKSTELSTESSESEIFGPIVADAGIPGVDEAATEVGHGKCDGPGFAGK